MTRPPLIVTIALGLIACGASTYAWHLHQELLSARARPAATPATPSVQPATPDLPASGEPAEPAAAVERPSRARRGENRLVESAGETARGEPERRENFRNNPQVRQLMAMQQRAMLDPRYAALFRKLNLAPADLEKLKALLVERQNAAGDVYTTAREQGLDLRANRDQVRDLVKNLEAESEASIRALLGEANYQQYRQYEQTAPQRGVVSQIEQRLSYSSTPLYGSQAEQLVALMASAAPSRGAGNTPAIAFAGLGGFAGGRVQLTDSVIAQSAGFLSAAQVQALREIQQEQHTQAQLLQEMRQNRRIPAIALPGSSGP